MGVLASSGVATVQVFRRPRVAIISSGNELVDIDQFDEVVAGRRIVSTNTYTLDSLTRVAGGVPVDLGIAADTKASLRRQLEQRGVRIAEIPEYRSATRPPGRVSPSAQERFWKVKMRQGAHRVGSWTSAVARLSGNRCRHGRSSCRETGSANAGYASLFGAVQVTSGEVKITAKLTHFLRASVTRKEDGTLTARLTGLQSSGALTSMAKANALLIVPETSPKVAKGAQLKALMIDQSLEETSAFSL